MTYMLRGLVATVLGGQPDVAAPDERAHNSVPDVPLDDSPFERHVEVELRFTSAVRPSVGRDTFHGLFALEDSRYSVRVQSSGGHSFRAPAEFLIPARAIPAFRVGTKFRVVTGSGASGTGEVKAVYGPLTA